MNLCSGIKLNIEEEYDDQKPVYFNKSYHGKEWLFKSLKSILIDPSHVNKSTCLVLLGETGTGKTHFLTELKWPTQKRDYFKINILFINFFNLENLKFEAFFKSLIENISNYFLGKVRKINDSLYSS